MYTILVKQELAPAVKLFEVAAPQIAKKAQAGQFIILRIDEQGERIPLTIADYSKEKGTVTIIFQEVGESTRKLGLLEAGECLLDFAGPLGKPTHVEKKGVVVCIGGGIGIAPVYPIARAMKAAGNQVISIIGARSKSMLIYEKEMAAVSDKLYITTDDGTKGQQGFVTDPLKTLIQSGVEIKEVIAIGPVVMMRSVAEVTRPYSIYTVVSLNPIMVDGTGMCGGCRVSVAKENKFACVDGPEFDAHQVDFAGLIIRQRMYREQELGGCQCHSC